MGMRGLGWVRRWRGSGGVGEGMKTVKIHCIKFSEKKHSFKMWKESEKDT